ncbi:hypothetical protein IMSAG049_00185 [Clostridiales bacterium]|nr:hypothetical protein IMSAG049_00185 [Clostridiales bacterium]
MKKYAFAMLTAALCIAAPTSGYGAVFSDIGSNLKWAESYINSVYDSKLMVGDYNSSGQRLFRGGDNMSYSEAAQLIYSITVNSGFSGDVTQTGVNRYSMEISAAGISDWAKNAVAFCMEKGIVSSYDLTKFKYNGADVKITREDMAIFFGRTLALNYSLSSGTTLSFSDTANISAPAKPYVELLNKMGIVSGDNNNNFNPGANINRAEVAVLASKTFDFMKKGNIANPESGYTQTTGTVVSIYEENGSWIVRLTCADGVKGFALTSATAVYNNANNNVGPAGLGLGDSITVYHSDASIAKVVITKDAVLSPNNVNTPQYNSVTKDKGELISAGEYKVGLINKHGDRVYYTVARDADITLNGRKATLRQLSDRVRGDALVEITVEMNSSPNEAYKVTAVEQKYTDDTEGRITNINRREITIKSGSKSFKYEIADDVDVKYNGSSTSLSSLCDKFDDLKGSKYIDVELTLNRNDEVTEIDAEASNYKEDNDKSYSGDIKSFDGSRIRVGGKDYDCASSVKIKITIGRESISDERALEEALDGGDVTIRAELTVNDGEVTRIEGYASELDGELQRIEIKNSSYPRGTLYVYVKGVGESQISFDEDTRISLDGTEYDDINIESAKEMIRKNPMDVTVRMDSDGMATSVKD